LEGYWPLWKVLLNQKLRNQVIWFGGPWNFGIYWFHFLPRNFGLANGVINFNPGKKGRVGKVIGGLKKGGLKDFLNIIGPFLQHL